MVFISLFRFHHFLGSAGWSSPVARQAHNLKVVGSNPTPATKTKPDTQRRTPRTSAGLFLLVLWFCASAVLRCG